MTILVSGCTSFVGLHLCRQLLSRGDEVIGVDQPGFHDDSHFKLDRLEQLKACPQFHFHRLNISESHTADYLLEHHTNINYLVHIADQTERLPSNPYAYTKSHIDSCLTVLELARKTKNIQHIIILSSASVYGKQTTLPNQTNMREKPLLPFGAMNLCAESLARSYAQSFSLPVTILRLFTVYGPWNRPASIECSFSQSILENKGVALFHNGQLSRDFVYIDDVIQGIQAALDSHKAQGSFSIYNLGLGQSESILDFLQILENLFKRKAIKHYLASKPDSMLITQADIEPAIRDFGYYPHISLTEGLARFVSWYRQRH